MKTIDQDTIDFAEDFILMTFLYNQEAEKIYKGKN
jgi:hypothetical protein